MNNRASRIIEKLYESKEKGVKETDLFNDFETSNSIRVARHSVRGVLKKMGFDNGLLIENGRWYLSSEFSKMNKMELDKMIDRFVLTDALSRIGKDRVLIVLIMSILIVISFVLGLISGVPTTIQECNIIFEEL